MKNFPLLIFTLTTLAMQMGESVKCYVCSSDSGNCFEGLCENATLCYRRETVANGRLLIDKGCENDTVVPQDTCSSVPGLLTTTSCVCFADMCNVSSRSQFPSIFLLLLILFVILRFDKL